MALAYYRTGRGAIVELDSQYGQRPAADWVAITAEDYATEMAAFAAVRPAARLARNAALQGAYAELVALGLSPAAASAISGYSA